ncbi:MAG TPA: GspH/FimT family pseudopilin [Gemmatimonadaceae bacterium]|nr:GspH/FimT family pseudopilin [Gemmatimonadaceae bacterium]
MRRAAMTLPELLLVLAMIGTLLALAVPPAAASADRAAVRAAARDIEALFVEARAEALARGAGAWVRFDSVAGMVRLRVPGTGTRTRAVGSLYGVAFSSSRDSMSYDGRGLGHGGANLTVVVVRGRARETLVVSRLGRVRR